MCSRHLEGASCSLFVAGGGLPRATLSPTPRSHLPLSSAPFALCELSFDPYSSFSRNPARFHHPLAVHMADLSTPSEAETRAVGEMAGVAATGDPQVAPTFPLLMGPPPGVEQQHASKSHFQQTTALGASIIGDEELDRMVREGKITSRAVAQASMGKDVPKPLAH